jgi:hypothetical protein
MVPFIGTIVVDWLAGGGGGCPLEVIGCLGVGDEVEVVGIGGIGGRVVSWNQQEKYLSMV